MDETANQIEAQIDRTRERLGSNLRELEDKVDAATDWREHFRERPHLFLGAAFIGGRRACERAPAQVRGSRTIGGCTQPGAPAVTAPCRRRRWNSGTTFKRRSSAWRAPGSRSTSANSYRASTSSIAALSSGQRRSIRQQRRLVGPRVSANIDKRREGASSRPRCDNCGATAAWAFSKVTTTKES